MLVKNLQTMPAPAWDVVERQIDARVLCSEEDMQKAYALRYRVYCLERGFLDLRDYPDRMETDKYDEEAVHVGLFDRETDEIVATARLVIINRSGAPMLEHCLFARGLSPNLDGASAEISRLVVNRHYALNPRNSAHDSLSCDARPQTWPIRETRISNPTLMLALCRLLYVESKARNVEVWYAAMERPLHRLLNRLLIEFEEIGPVVDYFGPVAPHRAFIGDLENLIAFRDQPMHELFSQTLR